MRENKGFSLVLVFCLLFLLVGVFGVRAVDSSLITGLVEYKSGDSVDYIDSTHVKDLANGFYNGTLSTSSIALGGCKVNECFDFQSNMFMQMPVFNLSSDYTMNFLYKKEPSISHYGAFFYSGNYPTHNDYFIGLSSSGNFYYQQVSNPPSQGVEGSWNLNSNMVDNVWYMVTAEYNFSNYTTSVYVDNVLVDGAVVNFNNVPFEIIGCAQGACDSQYVRKMDEVALYNRSLNFSERQRLFDIYNASQGFSSFLTFGEVVSDVTPPSISFVVSTDANNSLLNRSFVLVNVSAVDDVLLSNITIYLFNSSLSLVNSSTSNVSPLFVNFSGLVNGEYFFNATACDNSSNCNSSETRSVLVNVSVDLAPNISFVVSTDANNSLLNRSFVLVNVSAVDDVLLSNVSVYLFNSSFGLINSSTSGVSPLFINFSSLVNGYYYFNATACDSSNNCNSSETRSVLVNVVVPDTTPPWISFVYPTDNGLVLFRNYLLARINASDDVSLSNVSVYLYNSSFSLVSGLSNYCYQEFANVNTSCGGLGGGSYSYNGSWYNPENFVDGDYNTASYNKPIEQGGSTDMSSFNILYEKPLNAFGGLWQVSYDNPGQVPPENLTIPSDCWNYNSTYLDFVVTSDYTGGQHSWWYCKSSLGYVLLREHNASARGIIEEAMFWSIPSTINFTGLVSGNYFLNATACDISGNCNSTTTNNITLDLSAPDLSLLFPANNFYANNILVGFGINTSDDVGVANVSLTVFNLTGDLIFSKLFVDKTNINFVKLANPDVLPGNSGKGLRWNPSGDVLSVVSLNTPFVLNYFFNGSSFVKMANPDVLPSGFSNYGDIVGWSPDGQVLSVASSSSPFILNYAFNGSSFVKMANPDVLPLNTGYGLAWNPHGDVLSVGTGDSANGYVVNYRFNGSSFVKIANADVPSPQGNYGLAWNPQGSVLSIASSGGNKIYNFRWDNSSFVYMSNSVDVLPVVIADTVCWNHNGSIMTLVGSSSPFMENYAFDGVKFMRIGNPSVLPSGSASAGCSWSRDDKLLFLGGNYNVFSFNGFNFSKLGNPSGLVGVANGVSFNPVNDLVSFAHSTTPFVTTFNFSYVSVPGNVSGGVFSDGNYTWNVTSCDGLNSCNYSESRVFVVDTVSPVINFTSFDSGLLNRSFVNVDISVFDQNLNYSVINLFNLSGGLVASNNISVFSGLCYQEFANVSTGCGGLSSGVYFDSFGGAWSPDGDISKIIDGNYSSFEETTGVFDGVFFVNYSKPVGANNFSLWQVKDDVGIVNLSIFASCWNYDANKLVFRVVSSGAIFGDPSFDWSCYDGSWQSLRNVGGAGFNYSVYEEAMFWNISSSSTFVNLSDGVYFFNATVFDLVGHNSSTGTNNVSLDLTNPSVSYGSFSDVDNGVYNRSFVRVGLDVNDTYMNYTLLDLFNLSGLVNESNLLYTDFFVKYNFSLMKILNSNVSGLSSGLSVAWNSNGTMLAVYGNNVSGLKVFLWNGSVVTGVIVPDVNPAGATSGFGALAWSPDGSVLSVAHGTTPFVTNYFFNGTNLTKFANPNILPTGSGTSVAWNPSGSVLSVTHFTTPFVTSYSFNGSSFVKLANPNTLPASTGNGVAWNPSGSVLSVAHSTSPFMTSYNFNGSSFVKITNPGSLPTGTGNGVSWSPDGSILSVAHATSPFMTSYIFSGGVFTKITNPLVLPASTGNSISWNKGGGVLAVCHATAPFVTTYNYTGGVFVKSNPPDFSPPGTGDGCRWSPVQDVLAVGHLSSPFLSLYNWDGVKVFSNEYNFTFMGLSSGIYVFNATSFDVVGHSGVSSSRSVLVDGVSPVFVGTSFVDGAKFTVSPVVFGFNVSDDFLLSNVLIRLVNSSGSYVYNNNQGLSGTSYNFSDNFAFSVSGNYYFKLDLFDSVGNSVERNVSFVVHLFAPNISYEVGSDLNNSLANHNSVHVNVSATDDIELVNITANLYDSSDVLINHVTTSSSSLYVDFSGLSDGNYSFDVVACDSAVFCSVAPRRFVIIHNQPPEILSISPVNNSIVTSDEGLFNVSLNESFANLVSISFFKNDSSVFGSKNCTGSNNCSYDYKAETNPSGLSDGSYSWFVNATDLANNTLDSGVFGFDVDTIPPILLNLSVPNGSIIMNPVLLNVSLIFNESHPFDIHLSVLNGSNFLVGDVYCSLTNDCSVLVNISVDDDFSLNYFASDFGGLNSSGSSMFFARLDSVPPDIVFLVGTTVNNSDLGGDDQVFASVFANDTNFKNVSISFFSGNGTLLNQVSSNTSFLSASFNMSSVDRYSFYAESYDSFGNVNRTETRYVFYFLRTGDISSPTGYVAGGGGLSILEALPEISLPSTTDTEIRLVQKSYVVNLDSKEPVVSFDFTYVKKGTSEPVILSGASASVLDGGGSVIKTVVLSVDNSTGVYHFSSDFTGVSLGDYNINLNMGENSFSGVTALVTAYPPVLGLVYVDGKLSTARAIGLGAFALIVFFLGIVFIGSFSGGGKKN